MRVLYEEFRESQREYLGSFLVAGSLAESSFFLTLCRKKGYEQVTPPKPKIFNLEDSASDGEPKASRQDVFESLLRSL